METTDIKNLLHFLIWILAFATGWIAFFIDEIIRIDNSDTLYLHQAVTSIIFAHESLITSIITAYFSQEEFPPRTLFYFNCGAAFSYIPAGIVYILCYDYIKSASKLWVRVLVLINGILSLCLAILHIVEISIRVARKDISFS